MSVGYHGNKFMRSTYDPLPLPQVISFHNGSIIGPFCRHCGWRDEDHQTRTRRCPAVANGVIGPRCACHGVERPRRIFQ